MENERLRGLGTALITPFKADMSVDYESLDRLLDTQLTGDIDYIVVLGTTGEAATMTADEKREVRQHIADYVSRHPSPVTHKPLPLVLGVGGNNTAQVVSDLKAMHDELVSTYAAILSVCPYYNKPSQEGLYQHFCTVAQASPIPVILYNVPGRTGVNLLPETVMRIYQSHPDKICGIKEASGNVEQIKRLIALSTEYRVQNTDQINQDGLLVISGDDGIACELMQSGAAGLISVASNAFAHDFHQIVHEKDAKLQADYAEMIRLLFAEGNPAGIKTVLTHKGIIGNYLRLPLVANSDKIQREIAALL